MNEALIIQQTITYVKETLTGAEGGHDWWHIERVYNNARHIASQENTNRLIVELGALLIIGHVEKIIRHISFKGGNEQASFASAELHVVQDADRLDAMGAIGIARAFNYGGFKNRELYNPGIKPDMHMTKETYRNSTAPTINHFYEKLLLLKDRMNTETGRQMAEQRHQFMLHYLSRFYDEWDGLR